jgi:hypothetical protein
LSQLTKQAEEDAVTKRDRKRPHKTAIDMGKGADKDRILEIMRSGSGSHFTMMAGDKAP